MILFDLKNSLVWIGIKIMSYYWVQEELEDFAAPQIKGDFTKFILRELSFEEVKFISKEIDNMPMDLLEKEYQQCPFCLGLERNNEIAA